MSIFDRLLSSMFSRSVESPPGWARFFTPGEFARFLRQVKRHFRKRRAPFRIEDGIAHVRETSGERDHQFALQNLARLCHQVSEREWPAVIENHVRMMEKGWKEQAALSKRLHSFEKIKELLMVRLWPQESLHGMNTSQLILREDLEGTVSVLVYDLPSAIQNVNARDAEAWDRRPEELIEIGLANVLENCIPDRLEQAIDENVRLTIFSDENFYVASHALLLEHHADCIGVHGALVGVPHRHLMLCYPIQDVRVVAAVNLMIPIIFSLENDGPGSISRRLYWYREGRFVDLPYDIEGQTLRFFPPEDFMEMLNDLEE